MYPQKQAPVFHSQELSSLFLGDTPVRIDKFERYCLNDIHKAAGGESRHQPSNWLQNKETQRYLDELASVTLGESSWNSMSSDDRCWNSSNASDNRSWNSMNGQKQLVESIQGGLLQGTWAVRLAALDYARWLSPTLHVQMVMLLDAADKGQMHLHSAPAETEFDKQLELVTKLGAQFNLGKNEQLEMLRSTIEGYGLVVPHVIETNSELDTSILQPKRPAAKTDWAWVLKQYFEMLNNLEVNKVTHPYAFEEGLFLTRTSYIINCLYQNKKVWARMARHGLTSDRLLKRWCKAQGVVVQDGKEKSIQARRVANCCCFSLQALSELGIEL
ncbi:KilA-N domain-containing protein [Vibrio vulnificus]|uniref:KilA-N domain-containing protein n=1 Tax=Vibrio vulnificus TaxID=672 RepID=UPI001EEA8AE0|nr:KilA-N domain-containing protein [Vibrio vulnificus]MCG6265353.1 KilA-N domain-containing protein [Vibrio vulnificus]